MPNSFKILTIHHEQLIPTNTVIIGRLKDIGKK